MGVSRSGKDRTGRLGGVEPDGGDKSGRSLEWRAGAFAAAVRLAEMLDSAADYRASGDVLLDVFSGSLGIERQALYIDEEGSGRLRLIRTDRLEQEKLPEAVAVDSEFVGWLGRAGIPSMIDGIFRSSGELPDEELDAQDAFARAGLGSACVLACTDGIVGIYLYASGTGEATSTRDLEAAVGLMLGLASARIAEQLISELAEGQDVDEFQAVLKAVIGRIAEELETSLGVLKSGLWSIDDDSGGGSVIVDMARDSASRIGARVRELVSLSGIAAAGLSGDLEEVDLADLVEDVTREMIADFEHKDIVVSVEDGSGGRRLRADSEKLRFVLKCVLEDVISNTGRGSVIDIGWRTSDREPETPIENGSTAGTGPWMELIVTSGDQEDEGNAIDAVLDRIAAEQAGPGMDGTRSCMALSRYIVESHGGIWMPGAGQSAGISIWLPIGY